MKQVYDIVDDPDCRHRVAIDDKFIAFEMRCEVEASKVIVYALDLPNAWQIPSTFARLPSEVMEKKGKVFRLGIAEKKEGEVFDYWGDWDYFGDIEKYKLVKAGKGHHKDGFPIFRFEFRRYRPSLFSLAYWQMHPMLANLKYSGK